MASILPPGAQCGLHPDRPAAAACENCGTFGCVDCIGVLGEQEVCRTCVEDGRVTAYGIPWDNREELGLFRAWRLTTTELVMRPVQFFAALNPAAPLRDAYLFFGVSVGSVILLLFLCVGGIAAIVAGIIGFNGEPEAAALVGVFGTAYGVFLGCMMATASICLVLVHHCLLVLMQGASGGLKGTLRVALYSHGIYPAMLIPCVSNFVWIYLMALQAVGYNQAHEGPVWKPVSAVAIPAVFCCVSYLGLSFMGPLLEAFGQNL
ncbi:MAG: hypothetical protein VX498_06185 [Myxococcota bacterium]|nr:hypothetical protein [Myxococcota bacterium]